MPSLTQLLLLLLLLLFTLELLLAFELATARKPQLPRDRKLPRNSLVALQIPLSLALALGFPPAQLRHVARRRTQRLCAR